MVRNRPILATLAILVWLAMTPLVTADENAEQAPAPETGKAEFVAYYLHGNLRGGTCRNLEAYS